MRIQWFSANDPGWSAALNGLSHDCYHYPEYASLDGKRIDATPEAWLAIDGDRKFFVPYLIRSYDDIASERTDAGCGGLQSPNSACDVISPYGYPGILLSDSGRNTDFVTDGLEAFKESLAARGFCTAFLRMHPILGDGFDELFPPGTFADNSDTVAVDLTLDLDTIWSRIRPGHQSTLKRCWQRGFTSRFVPLSDFVDEFATIYEQTMNRVRAGESYFVGVDYFRELSRMPWAHCCIVEFNNRIAAACLFLECNGIVQAHLGGAHRDFLSSSPFHMTLHQAMVWGKERGNHWLHLGGGLGGSRDTLLSFKGGFSPDRFQFRTARIILDAKNYLRLVDSRSRMMNVSAETLLATKFFPAYRA